MKIKRGLSFVIIALVYALASAIGILTYLATDHLGVWVALLIADVVATVVTFIFSLIFKNASVYDPYWSVQPLVILLAFICVNGLNLASSLIFVAICIWSLRLTANWAYTFYGMEHQDWRYTMLKEKTGAFYPVVNFVGIHLVPTLIVYLCTIPAVLVTIAKPSFDIVCLAGLFLALTGIVLEFVADIQMHIFKKKRPSTFIRIGIWEHSRHPNYLGEILFWWGVAFYCIANMPHLWYLFVGALVNTLLFLCVSVPMAEGKQSKKEGFLEYVKETNLLLPFRKVVKEKRRKAEQDEIEQGVEEATE